MGGRALVWGFAEIFLPRFWPVLTSGWNSMVVGAGLVPVCGLGCDRESGASDGTETLVLPSTLSVAGGVEICLATKGDGEGEGAGGGGGAGRDVERSEGSRSRAKPPTVKATKVAKRATKAALFPARLVGGCARGAAVWGDASCTDGVGAGGTVWEAWVSVVDFGAGGASPRAYSALGGEGEGTGASFAS